MVAQGREGTYSTRMVKKFILKMPDMFGTGNLNMSDVKRWV